MQHWSLSWFEYIYEYIILQLSDWLSGFPSSPKESLCSSCVCAPARPTSLVVMYVCVWRVHWLLDGSNSEEKSPPGINNVSSLLSWKSFENSLVKMCENPWIVNLFALVAAHANFPLFYIEAKGDIPVPKREYNDLNLRYSQLQEDYVTCHRSLTHYKQKM